MNRVNAPDGTPLVFDGYEPERPDVAALVLPDWHPRPASGAERWRDVAARLHDRGIATYCLDQRGHGRSGGRRGHLSRFSQLLGDLQAFRRAVRRRHDVPQVLIGHGFGGLVVLRYLETQPGEPPAGAVVLAPWLGSRVRAAAWKRVAAKLADLWPTLPTGRGDGFITSGARAELQWAQRAVVADCQRIERPLRFLVGEQDQVIDGALVRALAARLTARATLLSYAGLSHELFTDPRVVDDLCGFLQQHRSSDRDPKN